MFMPRQAPTKKKTLFIFSITIIAGFILFALPNLFFGITKLNGGLSGINLLLIALFQLIFVSLLLYISLKSLGQNFSDIGWDLSRWQKDSLIGAGTGLMWAALQFGWIIPATGGANRGDIQQMLDMIDGTSIGLISFLALGVIGGGITEELYNRGYFINVLKDTFKNPKTGLWISAALSVLFFALGHLPNSAVMWMDIMVPTIAYTLLFLFTKRLTASIFAHSIYNASAILLTYYVYY